MKHPWVVIRSSSGSILGSGNGASVLSFVVGRRFLNSCFKWPFVVAGESFSCLDMRSSVSPGQVLRGPFFIAWMNAEGTELKNVAWRNRSNYFLVLFIWKIALAACDDVLVSGSGISHIPYGMLCLPVGIMLRNWRGFLLEIDRQSSSHSWPTDINNAFYNSEKTWVSFAAGGSDKVKWPTCSGSIVLLSGSLTQGPIFVGLTSTNVWTLAFVK